MKLRPMPLIFSMVIAAVVLFGGWFLYQNVVVASPLQQSITSMEGVEQADIEFVGDQLKVALLLTNDVSLRDIVYQIYQQHADLLNQYTFQLTITNEGSAELDQWWSQALFQVAEAMENRAYGDIPVFLDDRSSELKGLQVYTEMDDYNVYIRLTLGDKSKYIILPRTPAMMGVWGNETVR